ncbi:MAG TPA: GyrI-like domain-containing protein [Flavisolibacter sp.]|jgi:AraC family transcriptional regulator|nr:GyrI-like domain-containing protein [Flavisolibacter sp.]
MEKNFLQTAPHIKSIAVKKLVGRRMTMSLQDNRTAELWQYLMPRRREIKNAIGTELYSLQVYPPNYFKSFQPGNAFEKWGAIAVATFDVVPPGLESFRLPAGEYAIFRYKGASTDSSIYAYIFGSWLPASNYVLDNRPHFEVLGEKYKNADPNSEEEIYIPVRLKEELY